ncbi:hypothetical protein KAU33_09600 [Candidatus Dependentiae bacterium]|nr:hypothetical protein [Candidatus Dependentiae bacterium]
MNLFAKINWLFNSSETLGELYNITSKTKFSYYFEDPETGKLIKKFLPSIGQEEENPPYNELHKDQADSYTKIKLGKISYYPQFFAEYKIQFGNDYLVMSFVQTGLGLRITAEGISNIKVIFDQNGEKTKFLTPFNIFIRTFANQSIEFECSYQKEQPRDIFSPKELYSILWNLCIDDKNNLFVPVSMGWVKLISDIYKISHSKGPLIFNWDQSFSSILSAKDFPELSKYLIDQLINLIDDEGFIPQLTISDITTKISNPPILFLSVAYYYLNNKDLNSLKIWYPYLIDYINWWENNRRVDWNENLFTWGGDSSFESGLESGWDNSPLWERFRYDGDSKKFKTASTMASGLIILSYRILEILSKILGKSDEEKRFKNRRKEIIESIDKYMWSANLEAYLPTNSDGSQVEIITPGIYYTGFTGEINKDRFERSLKYIKNPQALGGDFLIPTLNRSDPSFNGDGDYWRGRVWPPVNFLVAGAIGNYSKSLANKILESSKEIFAKNFINGISGENYSSISGNLFPQQGVYSRNCPVYIWGGLLLMDPVLIFNLLHIYTK